MQSMMHKEYQFLNCSSYSSGDQYTPGHLNLTTRSREVGYGYFSLSLPLPFSSKSLYFTREFQNSSIGIYFALEGLNSNTPWNDTSLFSSSLICIGNMLSSMIHQCTCVA